MNYTQSTGTATSFAAEIETRDEQRDCVLLSARRIRRGVIESVHPRV